jgi:predicted PurR-regulated permease PerM
MNTDIEDDISENLMEDETFRTGIQKIGEMLSGEIKLIRTILISCLTVIIICILLYFNYILIGQFFTTIFLSLIVSLALKPTKEKILTRITNNLKKQKYFIIKCTAFIILKNIVGGISYLIDKIIWLFRKIKRSEIKIKESTVASKTNTQKKSSSYAYEVDTLNNVNLTVFNNKNYLYLLCLVYVVVFKLEFYLSLTLVFSYLFLDFLVRLIIDVALFLIKKTNKNSFLKYMIFQQKNNYEFNDWIHSLISFIIILFFTVIILIILGGSMWLFYIDMKSVVDYVRNNSDYMNYFKTILPENFKEYYEGENLNYFYNSKVYVHLKSFEVFVNSALEEQFANTTETFRGNYTLYEISNNLMNFIKDPTLIVNNHNFNKFQNPGYSQDGTNNNLPVSTIIEDGCLKYNEEILSRILSYLESEYFQKLYCGLRIVIDRFNLKFSLDIFTKYLKRGYKFFLKTFQLIAETFFLNALSFSIELINSIMLIILFYSCLFNFLKMKDDFIFDLLKFLPYPQKHIDKIHRSFHNSIQGVFVSSVEIFLYHTLLTWLIFDFCNIRFVFIFSIMSGIITLLPVITPWMILIPGNFLNFIDNEFSLIKITLFNLSYYLLINFVDSDIYKKNVKKSDPYFTGLSFVMGMYTFGLKGFIYGPVLLCVSITVIDIIKILIKFK